MKKIRNKILKNIYIKKSERKKNLTKGRIVGGRSVINGAIPFFVCLSWYKIMLKPLYFYCLISFPELTFTDCWNIRDWWTFPVNRLSINNSCLTSSHISLHTSAGPTGLIWDQLGRRAQNVTQIIETVRHHANYINLPNPFINHRLYITKTIFKQDLQATAHLKI